MVEWLRSRLQSGLSRFNSGCRLGDFATVHLRLFISGLSNNFLCGAQVAGEMGRLIDDRDYEIPFAFNGKIRKVTLSIDRPKLTPADIERLKKANATATDSN